MKVLKFGGTSVGSVEGLQNIKSIVTGLDEDAVVVVSALSGVTDQLLEMSRKAEKGDSSYLEMLDSIKCRHHEVVDTLLGGDEVLLSCIDEMLESLSNLLKGVFLLRILTSWTSDEIVSFGERMSSRMVAALIPGAVHLEALDMIRTVDRKLGVGPDMALTTKLVVDRVGGLFDPLAPGTSSAQGRCGGRVAVMGGFIAKDAENGRISNLGRGGSDYTASIIASILGADVLEIWTDVDGFMTADPKMVETSYVIRQLSYKEAMELCNFGAKVIYPPTLYPVRQKNIPIRVKNTFNPSAEGTVILEETSAPKRSITGISSIGNVSLLTLSGMSMVDLIGVDGRIFSSLAANDISAFLVCQSSSETGISIGVKSEQAPMAKAILEKEFEHAISLGAIDPLRVDTGLSTVAVVGENIKGNSGVAGKLFSILGRNGINVIALAQGADETNISFVVESKDLRKTVGVIHDGFLLSEYQELNLFICGIGTVGGQLIEQIAGQRQRLMEKMRLKLNIVGISRSTKAIFDPAGLCLDNYRQRIDSEGEPVNPRKLVERIDSMNLYNSVFVDCTASADVAAIYKPLFECGVNVVTANKIAASSDYANYASLKQTAMDCNVKFLYETNVGAGLPIIKTIQDLVGSGDHIEKIEAVLSGTLNFIFNTLSADIPLSRTVKMAQEQGFSEPDPRIDLCGKDVMRKLVILAREAGYVVNQEDVDAKLFIPDEFFHCSMEEFWEKLPSLDAEFESRRKELEAQHKRWRFVAKMEDGKFSVSLKEFSEHHSFYVLDGSNNIVLLTTERYHQHPMLIQGYGAGASVTAAGVFADIMRIANI